MQYLNTALDPSGVRALQLTPGLAGAAKIKLDGRGGLLEPLMLPLVPPVRVQLRRAGLPAACWEATFSAPTVSEATRFKSKSD